MQEIIPTTTKFLAVGIRSSLVMGIGGFVGGIYFSKTQPKLADKVLSLVSSAIHSIMPMVTQAVGG